MHLFAAGRIVLEAPSQTFSVRVASTAEPTVGQVFRFFHLITAYAACLTGLHRPRRYLIPLFCILLGVFHPLARLTSTQVAITSQRNVLKVPRIAIRGTFVLPQKSHCLPILLLYARRVASLPLSISLTVVQQLLLSIRYNLLYLGIGERQLVDQRVTLINPENFKQGVNCMYAMFSAATPAGTADLRADLYLVLLLVACFQRELCWAIFLHEVVAGLQSDVIFDHELFRGVHPVRFRS